MHQTSVTLVPYIPILGRAHMPTTITNTAFVATTTMYRGVTGYLKLGGQVVMRHATTALPLPHYYLVKKLGRQLLTRQLRPCKALVFTSHTFIKACCKMKLKKIFSRRLIFQPEKFILLLLVCQIKPVMVCTALNLATMANLYLARLDVQSLQA